MFIPLVGMKIYCYIYMYIYIHTCICIYIYIDIYIFHLRAVGLSRPTLGPTVRNLGNLWNSRILKWLEVPTIYNGWWLVVEPWILWLSIYWECHHPNWLSYFSEGLKLLTTNQIYNRNTVGGRNPAPVDRCFMPVFIGFQPSKVVQGFLHPRYHGI